MHYLISFILLFVLIFNFGSTKLFESNRKTTCGDNQVCPDEDERYSEHFDTSQNDHQKVFHDQGDTDDEDEFDDHDDDSDSKDADDEHSSASFDTDDEDDITSIINQGPMKVSRTLDISDGKTAWVIDNAVQHQHAGLMAKFFHYVSSQHDFVFNHRNYSKAHPNIKWNYGSPPWSRFVDMDLLVKTSAWKRIETLVEKLIGKKMKPEHSHLDILRAMDALPPTAGRHCAPNRYVLTFFLTKSWNLNNYGQVSFYSNRHNPNVSSTSRLEITESVHPHPYRVLLWPSCHPILFRAPCVNYFHQLRILNVWLSTNVNVNHDYPDEPMKAKHCVEVLVGETVDHKNIACGNFKFENPKQVSDHKTHLVRSFNDGDPSRQVNIFDGLFTAEESNQWRDHILSCQPPNSNPFDAAPLEDHDNVQWVAGFKVNEFMKTAMWPRLLSLCNFVSNHSEWYPYDVALNYVRSGDHTRIHPDSEHHQICSQEELTMVMYLSEGLTPSDYGETTFFVRKPSDGVHEFTGDGGELYEAIGTVTPKFGRVAIFTNNIEHSAHPPSSQFVGGRYTFALKVSRNKHLAFVKMAYEAMEEVPLDDSMEKLNGKLMHGYLDDPALISTATLEGLVEEMSKQRRQMARNLEKQLTEMLLQ